LSRHWRPSSFAACGSPQRAEGFNLPLSPVSLFACTFCQLSLPPVLQSAHPLRPASSADHLACLWYVRAVWTGAGFLPPDLCYDALVHCLGFDRPFVLSPHLSRTLHAPRPPLPASFSTLGYLTGFSGSLKVPCRVDGGDGSSPFPLGVAPKTCRSAFSKPRPVPVLACFQEQRSNFLRNIRSVGATHARLSLMDLPPFLLPNGVP